MKTPRPALIFFSSSPELMNSFLTAFDGETSSYYQGTGKEANKEKSTKGNQFPSSKKRERKRTKRGYRVDFVVKQTNKKT